MNPLNIWCLRHLLPFILIFDNFYRDDNGEGAGPVNSNPQNTQSAPTLPCITLFSILNRPRINSLCHHSTPELW